MREYENTTRSKITLKNHQVKLQIFFELMQIPGRSLDEQADNWVTKAREDPKWATQTITALISHQKSRLETGDITSPDTIRKFLDAIKRLCVVSDVLLNWDKIRMYMPRVEKGHGKYRGYTQKEIQQIISHPDRRIKPMVLLMASSGMDLSSFSLTFFSRS